MQDVHMYKKGHAYRTRFRYMYFMIPFKPIMVLDTPEPWSKDVSITTLEQELCDAQCDHRGESMLDCTL